MNWDAYLKSLLAELLEGEDELPYEELFADNPRQLLEYIERVTRLSVYAKSTLTKVARRYIKRRAELEARMCHEEEAELWAEAFEKCTCTSNFENLENDWPEDPIEAKWISWRSHGPCCPDEWKQVEFTWEDMWSSSSLQELEAKYKREDAENAAKKAKDRKLALKAQQQEELRQLEELKAKYEPIGG